MATKKRKSSSKRRAVRHTGARTTASKRRHTKSRRHTVSARHRSNPTYRRKRNPSRRHHRNPFGGGGEVVDFAGGGLLLGLAKPFADRFFGPYAQALGQFGGPALTAFTGWGLSKLLEMFGPTRRFAKPARILGYSTAVIQVVQPFVGRALAGVGAPANPTGGMGRRYRPGMNGIGVWPTIPPGMAPLPPAPPNAQGINGMAAMGMYGR